MQSNTLHSNSHSARHSASATGLTVGVFAIAFALAALLAYGWYGSPGVQAASLAFAACGAGVVVGRVAALPFRGPMAPLFGLLAGMIARLGVPLGVCGYVVLKQRDLVAAGFVAWILVAYLVLLASEVKWRLPAS